MTPREHARSGPDGGHTVVEMVMVAALVAVLLAAFGSATRLMTTVTTRLGSTAEAATQSRSATDLLSRSVPYASAVNTPTRTAGSWYMETLTTAVAAGAPAQCTQWQLDTNARTLRVRTWPQGSTSATAWTTAARDVVPDLSGVPPFGLLAATPPFTLPRVEVALVAAGRRGGAAGISAAYTLRNAGLGLTGGISASTGTDAVCTEFGRP